MWPTITNMMVSFVVHAESVRTRRITRQQEPFTVTYLETVSCPTTLFELSMEKDGLYWRMMKKKMILFLTLRTITTVPSLKILQWSKI
jgi:hypothetical protein